MKSVNPYTNQIIKEYALMEDKEVVKIIESAQKRFLEFKNTSFEERAQLMNKVADILIKDKKELAHLITDEVGKVYKESIAEIEKCVSVCKYYAKNAKDFLNDESVGERCVMPTPQNKSFITFQPLGIILAIMPWNFPFWQVFRFAAQAIMAGNVGLLKHASNVCGCALAIEEIFERAGFNKNIFSTLLIESSQVDKIIENKNVKAVTLTGSAGAGRAVAKKAGQCLKKSVLELGGSDPYIILADANLEEAAELCVKSRLINAGQSCIAAKRFIVVDKVYDKFLEIFTNKMKQIKFGDPNDEAINIGPLSSIKSRDNLHKQVQNFIKRGANCHLGGRIENKEIAFYPPTILTDIKEDEFLRSEELFGPAALILKAKDEEDSIRIANNSIFGLGSAIFSGDIKNATKIAKTKIEAGACFVNDFVKSDPYFPFGGIKESGYGRELSHFGIREFVNIKVISVK
jgi:succinate-semialdehyde dehydrogenase/glutarate-semialdehyde dehydrogenase